MENTIRVAIFADLHGKLLLPFKMVSRYQHLFSKKIDAILQCGDLGVFPDLSKLDKATIKHAEKDRDELGFHDLFISEKKEIKDFLDHLNVNMYAVRGNHEDHDFLDARESLSAEENFPVDCYERIFICKSGKIQRIVKEGLEFKFIGIGRIGDRKGRKDKKFIQADEMAELEKLNSLKENIHVLITHDAPADMTDPGYGMVELRKVLDETIPEFHFYGHTGQPFSNAPDHNGITRSVKIKELEFNEDGNLEAGSMIILELNERGELMLHSPEMGFLKMFNRNGWHYL